MKEYNNLLNALLSNDIKQANFIIKSNPKSLNYINSSSEPGDYGYTNSDCIVFNLLFYDKYLELIDLDKKYAIINNEFYRNGVDRHYYREGICDFEIKQPVKASNHGYQFQVWQNILGLILNRLLVLKNTYLHKIDLLKTKYDSILLDEYKSTNWYEYLLEDIYKIYEIKLSNLYYLLKYYVDKFGISLNSICEKHIHKRNFEKIITYSLEEKLIEVSNNLNLNMTTNQKNINNLITNILNLLI
ncbi:Uncharacterised protein [[Clostridium] sordellii]|uniref:hypothetical protein n=1 Tax=Paraclostridium sordellii TaxID=1505 RepID=UPI0005E7F7EB|nr:hypothetical protein [Paeniclostridium sordellii]CEQ21554.1 Uncharacterised protein [[Clostridium] sordellii] [Paeniclostridium sordellii]